MNRLKQWENMKKLMVMSLLLASMSVAHAEVTSNTNSNESTNKYPGRTNTNTKGGFWDFYTESQRKLVKPNDKEIYENLSKTIKPTDDFYEYVNKNWEDKTQIPSTKSSWGSFVELSEKNQDFLRNLIKELKEKRNSLNSDEKKILTLYESFYNMDKRNKLGLEPIKKDLKEIDDIKSIDDLQKYNIKNTRKGSNEFYGWGLSTDLNDSKNNAIYLESAGLGLSRDYYQKETPENAKILKEYTKFVSDVLKLGGETDTDAKAQKIVAFEKAIAQTLLKNEESHDVAKYNNPRKVSELSSITKNVNLANYLKQLNVNTDKVIITELNYYKNLDKFLTNENIDVIKDYMKFQKIAGSSSVLNDELGKRYFEFYGKYLNGQKERETLEKRALYFVDGTLGELVGKEYVKKNFSPEAKKNTQEMVSYIKKAFQNRINKLDWMSAETKKKAIQKLNKINVKIGYPDKWHDYSTLNINENDSLYDQMVKAGEWAYDKEFKKIGKPVDKTEWFMDAHTVNAYYSPTGNEIVFPAGIIQKPFYDFKNSEVGSNFGGIGAVIGHEITHGFDVSGAQFDGDGNVKNWWTTQDKQKFDAATKKLEDEFSNYTVGDNIKLNGKYTLTENIADLGGVNIAYDALQLYLADHPDLKVSNDTENELFFLNYANIWKQKATQEYRNNLAKTDSHSPNFLRVNSVLKNTDAFHKIFKTKPGDKMYRAPQDRVKIW